MHDSAGLNDLPQIKWQHMTNTTATAEKFLFVFLICLLIGLYCWCLVFIAIDVNGTTYYLLQDDPMIAMRYAYNFAHGTGLVFNSGEQVQGYTNLGFTLLMALVHCFGLPQTINSLIVQLLNLVVVLALMVLLYLHFRKCDRPRVALWVAALVAFNASIFTYAVCGWETPLQALLVTAAVLGCVPVSLSQTKCGSLPPFAPFLCALAAFVRLDAIIPFVVVSAYKTGEVFFSTDWPFKRDRNTEDPEYSERRAEFKKLFFWLSASALCFLLIFAFQKIYYGDWLPNTYFLKASADARSSLGNSFRLNYFKEFFVDRLYIVPLLCSFTYLTLGMRNAVIRKPCLLIMSLLAIWVGFVYWVGGDCFKLGRFFIMIIPIMEICTVLLIAEIWTWAQPRPFMFRSCSTLVVLLICIQQAVCAFDGLSLLFSVRNDNKRAIDAWNALKQAQLPAGALIGVFRAGTVPYLMPDMRFHDLLGKCDRTIAHTKAKVGAPGHCKWDYDYSLGVIKPTVIIAEDYDNTTPESLTKLIEEKTPFSFIPNLWFNEHFQKHYLPNLLPTEKRDYGRYWILFYR